MSRSERGKTVFRSFSSGDKEEVATEAVKGPSCASRRVLRLDAESSNSAITLAFFGRGAGKPSF